MKKLTAGFQVRRVRVGMWKWLLVWSVLLSGGAVQAQIVPDGTLGGERSTIVPRASGGDSIQGGAIRGANLFHSFTNFNVGNGGQVYFANPTGIQTILTRVTGSLPSNINGVLGVDGSANLFLLNPNGLVFGQNAKLDVRGSFVGTTANAIEFGTQGSFSATNPTTPGLLTVQPSALLYTQLQGGSIATQDAQLVVPTGQSLLLIGGDVAIQGGILAAVDGRIELGGLSALGSIGLSQTGGIWSLGFPEGVERSNVSLNTNSETLKTAGVLVSGNGGGSIAITAKTFEMSGDKSGGIFAGIGSGKGAIGARGGEITIDATDSVTLRQFNFIGNSVQTNGIGDGGNIVIKTGTLRVQDGFTIAAFHNGQGNGGNVEITARESVIVRSGDGTPSDGNSTLGSSIMAVGNRGKGNSGGIQITTGSLFLNDGGKLDSTSDRLGNSGDITINARDRVVIDGSTLGQFDGQFDRLFSSITTVLYSNAIGNGGNIVINTGTFSATNGGGLATGVRGRGNGGNISINARDSVTFNGGVQTAIDRIITSRATSALLDGTGNGGNIEITTGSLLLTAGGTIQAGTSRTGNSGNILISARDRVEVDGETADTVTSRGLTFNLSSNISGDVTGGNIFGVENIGNGGEIRIATGNLAVTNGAVISSNTAGKGNAGNISIDARDSILVDGNAKLLGSSAITSRVIGVTTPDGSVFRGTGQGGNLSLNARQITVSNGGYVSSSTLGDGNAGNLSVNARDSITIQGASSLTGDPSGLYSATYAGSNGQGGALQVRTGSLSLLSGGVLASSNRGSGNAGSIHVQANTIQLKDGAEIRSFTTSGNGGNIFLTANDYLLLRRNSSITASATNTSNSGNSGNISINAGQIIAPLNENNTIAANATQGNGGNVSINTQGLYGIAVRSILIPGLSSITASSDLGVQGQITLTQPQVQPTQGTIELPRTVIDASAQIVQSCPRPSDSAKLGKFVISGTGSLPPNPINPLEGAITTTPLASLDTVPENRSIANAIPKSTSPAIIEAQGWVKNADGKVELVARTPERTQPTIAACPDRVASVRPPRN